MHGEKNGNGGSRRVKGFSTRDRRKQFAVVNFDRRECAARAQRNFKTGKIPEGCFKIRPLHACVFPQVPIVKENVRLCNLTDKMWTAVHQRQIMEYLVDTSVQLMLVYIDTRNGLTLAKTVPAYQLEEVAYFIKPLNTEISEANFYSVFQMGTVKGNFVDSLLRAMHDLYAPTFFESSSWPDSILKTMYANLSMA